MAAKLVLLVVLVSAFCLGSHAEGDGSHRPKAHEDKLSDAEHIKEGEHNPDYDHEAFLGSEKEEFDNLAPEEAKTRLRALIKKVDKDGDGAVTTEELTEWVRGVFLKRSLEGVDNDIKDKDTNQDGKVDWMEYQQGTYGEQGEQDEEMKEFLRRDKRRFDAADKDKDGALNREEMATYLHPESSPEMSDVHILETIEDIDRDKDGFISLKEFLGEYEEDPGSVPDWVKDETARFNDEYDKNKDGKLDKEEVKQWILPETDHLMASEEAKHLVSSSDDDGDGKLTVEEIERNYAVFVGSEATDYGQALPHQEL